MQRHVDPEALPKMVKCAMQDYCYKDSIPGHPYLPEKYWLSQEEGRAHSSLYSDPTQWPRSPSTKPNLDPDPHSNPVSTLSPHMTWATYHPIQAWLPNTWPWPWPWPWRRRSRPCLLGAPCLCQRTGRVLGLIPRGMEGILTSKQIPPGLFWVPTRPIFLVTLDRQAPHLSCIPLHHQPSPLNLEIFSNLRLPA